jgi:hypothetical protein
MRVVVPHLWYLDNKIVSEVHVLLSLKKFSAIKEWGVPKTRGIRQKLKFIKGTRPKVKKINYYFRSSKTSRLDHFLEFWLEGVPWQESHIFLFFLVKNSTIIAEVQNHLRNKSSHFLPWVICTHFLQKYVQRSSVLSREFVYYYPVCTYNFYVYVFVHHGQAMFLFSWFPKNKNHVIYM